MNTTVPQTPAPRGADDIHRADHGAISVSVCGLGLMGSAIAQTLIDRTVAVTVWNRSPEKSAPFHGAARLATSATDAVAGSDVTVFVLADYAATEAALHACGAALSGRTVVNLCTGRPTDAQRVAAVVTDAGATYLDGAIEAYPGEIGHADTLISYSGARTAWEEHRQLLTSLAGRSHYLGADPGAANVLDAAMAGAFYNGSLGAFHEAVAFADRSGIALTDIKDGIDYWAELLRRHAHAAIDAVIAEDYRTDQATLEVYLAAARTWLDTVQSSGQNARILAAYTANLDEAHAAGVGGLSLTAHVGTLQAVTTHR